MAADTSRAAGVTGRFREASVKVHPPGFGFHTSGMVMHRVATQRNVAMPEKFGRRMQLRITNDRHIVTIHHRPPGGEWAMHGVRIEVSGYHHNTAWDFLSLRPGIYCAGEGEGRIRAVTYRAL